MPGLMAGAPVYPTLLMFVAGEPDLQEPVPQTLGSWQRLGSFVIPARMLMTRPTPMARPDTLVDRPDTASRPDPSSPPWRIVGEHAQCVEMVAEIAGRHGLAVKVVDVNLAKDEQSLVRQYVDDQDVLPILVRLTDRARLEGQESFVPSAIERFVTGR